MREVSPSSSRPGLIGQTMGPGRTKVQPSPTVPAGTAQTAGMTGKLAAKSRGKQAKVKAARKAAAKASARRLPPEARERMRKAQRGIALLTAKQINGIITPAERALLGRLHEELATLNRMASAPRRPVPRGKREAQGPAGGVRRVVSGGAPGLGKR